MHDVKRSWRIARVALVLALVTTRPTAGSDGSEMENYSRALNIIADLADRLCGTEPRESTSETLTVQGEAELKKSLPLLADLGVKGAVGRTTEHTTGPLQKDIARVIKTTSRCKVDVLLALKDKLGAIEPPREGTPRIDFSTILRDTAWNVAAYDEDGKRGEPHPVPWEFHPDHTVNAGNIWHGSWEQQGSEHIVVRIPVTNDLFTLDFPSPTEFVAYKDGKRYRWGVKR